MARAMHEPLLFYHSIVFSGCIQLSLYMYANSCSIEAFLLHLAYLSSEFKVGATYISTVQLALFPGISGSFTGLSVVPSSAISTFGRSAFLYAFFIEQPHNTGTIARTANNIFSYVSPLSISLYYLLLHILMRKQGRESWVCLLGISTQMAQIGKYGRDSRGCLLEISTQMAQISERVEISGAAS